MTDQPVEVVCRRVRAAMFNASITSLVCIERAAFQSTMRRENTSIMNAM